MRYIDISVPLTSSLPAYSGEEAPRVWLHSSLAAGSDFNVTALQLMAHSGTHVDAPMHVSTGGRSADQLPFESLIGPATVIDARELTGHIDLAALDALGVSRASTRLLFRTRNSQLWDKTEFDMSFCAITEDAASALVELGVELVGIDYLSVGPASDPLPTHRVLLDAGVVILEGLDLRRAAPGDYRLICLPLLIPGADGAPARAVLESA